MSVFAVSATKDLDPSDCTACGSLAAGIRHRFRGASQRTWSGDAAVSCVNHDSPGSAASAAGKARAPSRTRKSRFVPSTLFAWRRQARVSVDADADEVAAGAQDEGIVAVVVAPEGVVRVRDGRLARGLADLGQEREAAVPQADAHDGVHVHVRAAVDLYPVDLVRLVG